MECRSLGEEKGNYANTNIRQIKQQDTDSHQSSSGNTKLAVGLLAGVGVGVLAGMLLAPEKGRDLRRQVANSATKLGDQVTKSFDSAKEKVSNWSVQDKYSGLDEQDDFMPANSVDVHKNPYADDNRWNKDELKDLTNNAHHTPGRQL